MFEANSSWLTLGRWEKLPREMPWAGDAPGLTFLPTRQSKALGAPSALLPAETEGDKHPSQAVTGSMLSSL